MRFLASLSLLIAPLELFCSSLAPPVSASSSPPTSADYHEQLVLRPLPHSALLASFAFRSNTSLSEFEKHNYRFFPRSLAQILQHANTRELHLRFSLGRWDAESWGVRPWRGTKEGGTGVELWAWVEAENDEEADHKWLILTNALSGLFCASLNFIDGTRTIRPIMSFPPEGDHADSTMSKLHLLHGVLPREVVCTENLTPFLKLLPCKGKAGISTLLDGHKLFDASWQSMAIDIRPICPEGGQCMLQIEQTIDMVLDVERSKRPRGNPIPRPQPAHDLKCNMSKPYHSDDTCFPADFVAGQEWSLNEIFGKSMHGTCPLTDPDTAPICIQVPTTRDVYTSVGGKEVFDQKTPNQRCYFIPSEGDFSLVLPPASSSTNQGSSAATEYLQPETPLLYAERSLTGYGQERGGVQTILTNPSPDQAVEFVYMESLPWFMRIYLHTLNAQLSPRHTTTSGSPNKIETEKETTHKIDDRDVIQSIYYRPFLDRHRGTHLELRMRMPPASTALLRYDFEKSILRYTEYPPDANRGFDVAAAVITITNTNIGADRQGSSQLRTTSLLLNLPTPDFSMPYNVIIFTSTAIALAFGGLYNILVRRFVGKDEGPAIGLLVLRDRVAGALGKVVQGWKEKRRVAMERRRVKEKVG